MVTVPEGWQFLIDTLDPLREPLHDALPEAAELAESHFDDFDMHPFEYQAGRAHLARCHARRLLKDRFGSNSYGGWQLAKPGPNGRLWLHHGGLSLRLLRPLPNATPPPPGLNPTRVAFYSNIHLNLLGVAGSNLIGLWDVDDGQSSIRIVRPRGRWRYGSREKIDIDFVLPHAPDSLASLEFMPSGDDFEFDLPFEDTDEEGKEGGSNDPNG